MLFRLSIQNCETFRIYGKFYILRCKGRQTCLIFNLLKKKINHVDLINDIVKRLFLYFKKLTKSIIYVIKVHARAFYTNVSSEFPSIKADT